MLNWSYHKSHTADIPDGVYTAKIIRIEETTAKSSGNPMWRFTFALKEINASVTHSQVVDGNFDAKTAAHIANAIARIGMCFGIDDSAQDIPSWLNHTGIIEITHKRVENNVYLSFNFPAPNVGKKMLTEQIVKTQGAKSSPYPNWDDTPVSSLDFDTESIF